MAGVQPPAAAVLLPAVRHPAVARPRRRFPVAAGPHVAAADPVPVAVDPYLADHGWRADVFGVGCGRCRIDDVAAVVRLGRRDDAADERDTQRGRATAENPTSCSHGNAPLPPGHAPPTRGDAAAMTREKRCYRSFTCASKTTQCTTAPPSRWRESTARAPAAE